MMTITRSAFLFFVLMFAPFTFGASQVDPTLQKIFSLFVGTFNQSDLIDRCQITTKFVVLDGYWGSVETERKDHTLNDRCEYEIKIAHNLYRKVESQLVLIHELSHVIRDFHQPNEERWVNEGLAQVLETEYIGLWPTDKEELILNSDRIFLSVQDTDYSPRGLGYTTSFFFMKYLFNHFGGKNLMEKILTSKKVGWDNIEFSIKAINNELKMKIPEKFLNRSSLWTHFSFSILLNDPRLADFGLFQLDYKFNPFAKTKSESTVLLSKKSFPTRSNFSSETFFLPLDSQTAMKSLDPLQLAGFDVYCYEKSPAFRINKVSIASSVNADSCPGQFFLFIKSPN